MAQQLVHCDGLAIRLGTEALERAAANPAALEDVWTWTAWSPPSAAAAAAEARINDGGPDAGDRDGNFPSPELAAYGAVISAGRAAGHQPLAFAVVAHVPCACRWREALQPHTFSRR